MYLLYFSDKTVRILIDSGESPLVLAFDSKIFKEQNVSTGKDRNYDIMIISILNSPLFIKTLLNLTISEEKNGITMSLKKDSTSQEGYRYLKVQNGEETFLVEVDKPIYDREEISSHRWLHGHPKQTEDCKTMIFST